MCAPKGGDCQPIDSLPGVSDFGISRKGFFSQSLPYVSSFGLDTQDDPRPFSEVFDFSVQQLPIKICCQFRKLGLQ